VGKCMFWLWIYQKMGLISFHRKMEKRPFVQDSNGEANLSIIDAP
jgi:hypothetical protein